jgi:carboxymethylenebutenolidase
MTNFYLCRFVHPVAHTIFIALYSFAPRILSIGWKERINMPNHREILMGISASVAGLPLATTFGNPTLVRASVSLLERHSLALIHGKTVDAYLGPSQTDANACSCIVPRLLGPNDQTKAITQEFTNLGYVALALDLFGGKVATVRGDAKRQVGRAKTHELSQKWLRWLKSKEIVNRKFATICWGFGGSWAL